MKIWNVLLGVVLVITFTSCATKPLSESNPEFYEFLVDNELDSGTIIGVLYTSGDVLAEATLRRLRAGVDTVKGTDSRDYIFLVEVAQGGNRTINISEYFLAQEENEKDLYVILLLQAASWLTGGGQTKEDVYGKSIAALKSLSKVRGDIQLRLSSRWLLSVINEDNYGLVVEYRNDKLSLRTP